MGILADLLRIKKFREQKAERALIHARQELLTAEEKLSEAKHKLKEFRIKSALKEKELYDDLCKRMVSVRELDNVKVDIELMKERDDELAKELAHKEELRVLSHEKERSALEDYNSAARLREKFDQILANTKDLEAVEEEKIQDAEIEESSEVRFILSTEHEENARSSSIISP